MTKQKFLEVIKANPVKVSRMHASYSDVILTVSNSIDADLVRFHFNENGLRMMPTVRVNDTCFNVIVLIPVKFDTVA